jgi:hypothetical protein
MRKVWPRHSITSLGGRVSRLREGWMSLEAIVIAGANGAGKTTFARQFIPVAYPDAEFLNADEIQREGAPFAHRVSAGKEFLRRLSALERRRESFAVEITMSSRMYVKRLRRWNVLGYRTSLHFIRTVVGRRSCEARHGACRCGWAQCPGGRRKAPVRKRFAAFSGRLQTTCRRVVSLV